LFSMLARLKNRCLKEIRDWSLQKD
jgi:hypothetical protein